MVGKTFDGVWLNTFKVYYNSTQMIQVCLYLVFKFKLPAKDTFYHCTTFNMPDIGGKRHVIRVSITCAS